MLIGARNYNRRARGAAGRVTARAHRHRRECYQRISAAHVWNLIERNLFGKCHLQHYAFWICFGKIWQLLAINRVKPQAVSSLA